MIRDTFPITPMGQNVNVLHFLRNSRRGAILPAWLLFFRLWLPEIYSPCRSKLPEVAVPIVLAILKVIKILARNKRFA